MTSLSLVNRVEPLHFRLRMMRVDNNLLDCDPKFDRCILARIFFTTYYRINMVKILVRLQRGDHHPSPSVFPPEVKLPMWVLSSAR